MVTKSNNLSLSDFSSSEGIKDFQLKYNINKLERDFYHEEDNIIEKIINVKRTVSLSNDSEQWKILENNKNIFSIEGDKLTEKEKEFLRTVEGVNFIIKLYKIGINSFNLFKIELKKKLYVKNTILV